MQYCFLVARLPMFCYDIHIINLDFTCQLFHRRVPSMYLLVFRKLDNHNNKHKGSPLGNYLFRAVIDAPMRPRCQKDMTSWEVVH